ncbi:hypothetical protein B0J17DRAFT_168659 [Rhizoctonia solani]|nr:hypothetical protein B0J17DRAFT_168659 [Rhizoctonia solani]
MSDVGSPLQLRDSMRKMRKRVASVIRRGSSSKNIKSRSGSEDPDKSPSPSHHSDHEEPEHDSEHTPSRSITNPNSAASSTHSLNKSIGSRPASPSPQPASGSLSPATEKVRRKRSLVNLSFPRSPSKKNKSKEDSAPSSPDVRSRTFSTPGTPIESEPTKLSIPVPARPRTLSHPLAASPIMPSSPDKDSDNVRPKPSHSRAASSPGTGAFGALASAASTLAAMTASPPIRPKSPSPPAVILTPPGEAPAQIQSPSALPSPAEQPISAPDVTTPNVTITDAPKPETSGQPRDKSIVDDAGEREQPTSTERVPSPAQGREPLPREQGHSVKRTASTVGSEMGWSMLETTLELPEEEDTSIGKVEQASKVNDVKVEGVLPSVVAEDAREPNKVEDVPAKAEVASLYTEESGVKVEKDNAVEEPVPRRNSLMFDPTPDAVVEREPLPSSEGEEHHEGAFVMSPEASGHGTPQPTAPEPSADVGPTGIFIETPPVETRPTWITLVSTPPRVPSPKAYPEFTTPSTPPAQTSQFNPEHDGGVFSTPDNHKSFQSNTSPGSSQLSDTPSKFFDLNKDDLGPLPSGITTPPRPHETVHYPGDATPPPPAMSESFFHPRNLERLNPRHLERSMSTMGVFGDAEPDGAGVQERLKRATAA